MPSGIYTGVWERRKLTILLYFAIFEQFADTTFQTGKNSFTYEAKLACNLPDNETHVYFRVPDFEEGESPLFFIRTNVLYGREPWTSQ